MNSNDEKQWGKVRRGRQDEDLLAEPRKFFGSLYRAFAVGAELFAGMHAFRNEGPCVTVFGSARFEEGHPYYELARETGRLLSEAGFTVLTGGGPGIMEAANRGAWDVGGRSLGCNIKLPKEQVPNPYLDKWITFRHFFIRKVMLIKNSSAIIVLPGGYGTLDEIFETATLLQTQTIQQFPVVILGEEYWVELRDFIEKALIGYKTISPRDVELFRFAESPREAVDYILEQVGTVPGQKKSR